MPPSAMVPVAPTTPSSMVLPKARPKGAVLPDVAVMFEGQHVGFVEAEELEERAQQELADRQRHGQDEEGDADRERHPAPPAQPRDIGGVALARHGGEAAAAQQAALQDEQQEHQRHGAEAQPPWPTGSRAAPAG